MTEQARYPKVFKLGDLIEIEGYIVYEEGKAVGELAYWTFYNLDDEVVFTGEFEMPDLDKL